LFGQICLRLDWNKKISKFPNLLSSAFFRSEARTWNLHEWWELNEKEKVSVIVFSSPIFCFWCYRTTFLMLHSSQSSEINAEDLSSGWTDEKKYFVHSKLQPRNLILLWLSSLVLQLLEVHGRSSCYYYCFLYHMELALLLYAVVDYC